MIENENDTVECLNCGCRCSSRFCPDCGQPTSTRARLTVKSLAVTFGQSFLRFNPAFLNTLKGLVLHPWTVIRDYLYGRRASYTPPVTMLILVILYCTVITLCIDGLTGRNLRSHYSSELSGFMASNPLLAAMMQSEVLQCIVLAIPVAFCAYIVYWRAGSRRFNFAEYMMGAVYMMALSYLVDFVCIPVAVLCGEEYAMLLQFAIMAVYCRTLFRKAFRVSTPARRVLLFVLFVLMSCVVWLLLCVLVLIVMVLVRPELFT